MVSPVLSPVMISVVKLLTESKPESGEVHLSNIRVVVRQDNYVVLYLLEILCAHFKT